jgi:NadR type nicotinamide-nucleotide adenylyltransferase
VLVTNRGFLLGKFMPPHAGHVAMCRMAAALVGELTVMVCTRDCEPVPGGLRADWMQAVLPGVHVVHYDQDIPQEPAEDADFWAIWTRTIRDLHPDPIDLVFGSEPYVTRLAGELGARPVLADPDRRAFPVSSSEIRDDAAAHWWHLPGPVRPWYQKRVVTFGAESTGKSTLAQQLADGLGGPLVPEYGRTYEAERGDGPWNAAELIELARRHEAHRAAIAPWGGPVLAEDTDPLMTAAWAEMLLGHSVPELEARPQADLYLLLDADVPFVQDGGRYFADGSGRRRFQARCEALLQRTGARFEKISGTWDERTIQAEAAVEGLLAEPFPGRWALPETLHPVLAGTA